MKAWQHFYTITHHKILVAQGCFKVGLYRQGLFHDMSKYGFTEFLVGAKYYQGNRSPNNAEKEDVGYSSAWLHHKGRNKHHFEYWIDYPVGGGALVGMKMPDKYIIEMVMDRIAASKIYKKEAYTDSSPLEYYERSKGKIVLHEHTRELLERCLNMLAKEGEEKTFRYIKREILGKKKRR